MHKVSRKQWFIFTLPGLMLLATFLINSGVEALFAGIPDIGIATAYAEDAEQVKHLDVPGPPAQTITCDDSLRRPNFGGSVVVGKDKTVCGDLTSFGGKIVIHGEVKGDVVVFGGDVILNGYVDGNMSLYGGSLITPEGAHVNGDIHVCGGNWTDTTGLQLHGSFYRCTGGVNTLLGNDTGLQNRFWYIVTWIMLSIILITLLPEHVMMVRTTVRTKTRRSLALGLLSTLLAPVILAVLIALIIAIPLAILVAIGFIAAWALGTIAIGWIIGDMIVQRIAPQQNTRLVQIVVGVTVLTFLGSLPYVGWIISVIAGMIGLGAVFLSRFGTRLYSQPRHPIIW